MDVWLDEIDQSGILEMGLQSLGRGSGHQSTGSSGLGAQCGAYKDASAGSGRQGALAVALARVADGAVVAVIVGTGLAVVLMV